MSFKKYFKQGQKILLQARHPDALPGRYEALTVFLHGLGPGHVDLLLPYENRHGEEYPFGPEMPVEILSDAMGLGVRLSGSFQGYQGPSLIRVNIRSDLQLFQRRLAPRLDLRTGLRFTRGRGTLRSFREQWEKNIRILETAPDLSKLPPFPDCQLNLSSGGIRFSLSAPPEIADLCLLLLTLDRQAPPICVLAEVVWVKEQAGGDRHTAGMRFISILEEDRQKIDRLIKVIGRQDDQNSSGGTL
jgi:hypothetical protein